MSKSLVSIIIGVIVLAAIVGAYSVYRNGHSSSNPAASSTPSNASMTGSIINAVSGKPGWEELTTATSGISFEYPASLDKTYITTVVWPPTAEVLSQAFACAKTGSMNSPAGGTEEISVNGRTYCKAAATEGISGSVYDRYVYAFPENGNTATIAFALRFADCGRYNKTQMAACENEEKSFSVNALADSMATTFIAK